MCNNRLVHFTKIAIYINIHNILTFEDSHRKNTTGQQRDLRLACGRQDEFCFLSESASTKAIVKSTMVKNTHYSGILRPMDQWLQPATPSRVYFPVEILGGRLSRSKRKQELIECLDLPKRLRQLPRHHADWQPDGPMNREASGSNLSHSQCCCSESEVGGVSLFFPCDATLQDFYHDFFPPLFAPLSPQQPARVTAKSAV